MTTHNLSQSPEYGIFHGIKNRCENLNEPAYMHYGGRGIKCCFTSVMDLLDAIGERPSTDHSVDRIDNDGHYEKGNVRWSTALEQSHNTRKNIALTIDGKTKLLVEWHQELHLSLNLHTLYYRHYAGWCDACIVHNTKGQKCQHLI